MPTVPSYDSPQVDSTANPSMRFDAPAMPDVAGKQLQETGKATLATGTTVMKIADRLQDIQDDAATTAADNAYQQALSKILHDPNGGYLTTQMRGAQDARPDADEALLKARSEAAATLKNDVQRLMFEKVASKRELMARQVMDVHQGAQLRQWEVGEKKAAAGNARDNAVTTYASWRQTGDGETPPGQFAIHKADMISKTKAWLTAQGVPLESEVAKGAILEQTTKLHTDVVGNMVSLGQGGEARQYLDNAIKSGEVDPGNIDQLKNLVKTAGIKEDSLRLSMEIKGPLTTQIATADKLFKDGKIDAELRDALVTRMEHNWHTVKAMQAEGNKTAMGSFQDWILKNPGKSIQDAPVNLYAWAKREGHLAALDGFAQREGRPGERRAELKTRGELIQLATSDPDAFIGEFNRTSFLDRTDLGLQGIKEMQNIAGDMIRGNGKYHFTFDQKILQDAIPKALLAKDKKDERDAFVAIMSEEGEKWKKANPGKTPDKTAYEQVMQTANREWVSIGKYWNSTDPAYVARAKQDAKAVPAEFYNNAVAAQKRAGRKVDEDEILRKWATVKNTWKPGQD